jgi:hypothetical protein
VEYDNENFRREVRRIKAEQFFEEKTAEPRLNPVAVVNVTRACAAEDPELLKVAMLFCGDEDPYEFYEAELGGKFKASEKA